MGATNQSAGFFGITKGRLIIVVSLALTWWLAYLLPHYSPMIQREFHSRLDDARKKIPNIKVDWQPSKDPRAAYNNSKIALIVESRPIPHLVPQILHMIEVIPPDWRMVFIGSEKSVVSVGRAYAVKNQQFIGKLDLMVLPKPWEIDSKEKIHRLYTDLRFYEEFLPGVEWILKFEHDSILCANSETSLNDWLHWGWAGAPRTLEDRFSGNGGLSLRRVSVIKRILGFQARYNDSDPEDEWFGKRLWVLPGEKVAAGTNGVLAVEDIYIEKPMGYHVRDGGNNLADEVWKDHKQRKKILEYCPELSLIMDMKLLRERCKGDNEEGVIIEEDDKKQKEEEAAKKKKKLEEENKKKQEAENKKADEEAKKKAEEERKKADEDKKKAEDAATKQPQAADKSDKSDKKPAVPVATASAVATAAPASPAAPDKATLQGLS